MAKFRRGIKRKRTFKRRKSFRRRGSSKKFQRGVRRVIQQTAEKKAINQAGNPTINGVTGTFLFFPSGLVQGTGATERIGNQYRVRSLKINTILQVNSASTTVNRIKVLVGCWRDYQTSTPDVTSFYQYPSSVVAYSPYLREPLQNKEWIPMYDRNIMLAASGRDNKYTSEIVLSLSFSGKKLPKKLKTVNGAGFAKWQYFIMFFGTDVVNPALAVWNSRLTFTDV